MPLCLNSKCSHPGKLQMILEPPNRTGRQRIRAICGICKKMGPFGSSISDADSKFRQLFNHEEIKMPTFEEGYRKGVEDAGEVIFANMPVYKDSVDMLNAVKSFLRKSLLTKKVTKWVSIYRHDVDVVGVVGEYSTGRLHDSKEMAESWICGEVVGTYPIEIEVPIG